MKKKRQPAQKQKDFISRPFEPLKGIRTDRPLEARPVAVRKRPAEDLSPDEAELFLRAVGDARRIETEPVSRDRSRPAPARPSLDEQERAVFLSALENLQLDVTFRDGVSEEDPARPLPVNRLRQLKRGAIKVDLQLDLHGLTRHQAVEGLEQFIRGAYQRKQQAVLVITGKGNRSPGEPILQRAVSAWLREQGKSMVAEFASAPRELGGSGALVVFLKERQPETGQEPTVD